MASEPQRRPRLSTVHRVCQRQAGIFRCRTAAARGDTAPVGYDPYRKHSITRIDYLLVALATLVALGLVLWAVLA